MVDAPVVTLSTIVGLQTIFTPVQLNVRWMTSADVLMYGEQWRIRTKTFLPFHESDDEELRSLKVDINSMPSENKPLDNNERAKLGALLAVEKEKIGQYCWNHFLTLNANAEFPFVCAIKLLKKWVRRAVPLHEPEFPFGMSRLFEAIVPDPLLCEMYDLVVKKQGAPTFFVNIFDFNRKMKAMHERLLQEKVKPFTSTAIYRALYGVPVNEFPRGWTEKNTIHFCRIAQKYN